MNELEEIAKKEKLKREERGSYAEGLMIEAQEFIDNKRTKEDHDIWYPKHRDCEFTIDLGNDIINVSAEAVYELQKDERKPYIIDIGIWELSYCHDT